MVSLSIGRVIRRKRRLLPRARLHQFHRPSDGTSGELGFIRPRSSFSFLLYEFPRDVKNHLFDHIKQTIPRLMLKYERHTSVPFGHDWPPAWPCKLSIISEARRRRDWQRMCVRSDNWFAMKPPFSPSGMRSSLLVAPTKACSINPHAMENHGDLASHRDFGALHAASLGDSQTPSLER